MRLAFVFFPYVPEYVLPITHQGKRVLLLRKRFSYVPSDAEVFGAGLLKEHGVHESNEVEFGLSIELVPECFLGELWMQDGDLSQEVHFLQLLVDRFIDEEGWMPQYY